MPNAIDKKLVIWKPSLQSICTLFTINKNGMMNIKTINVVTNIPEYIVASLNTPEYFTEKTKSVINNTNKNTAFRKRLESLKKEYRNNASEITTRISGKKLKSNNVIMGK